jgi:hypothetical protein
MTRTVFAGLVVAILVGGSLSAHHDYTAYDRDHPVSIEGDIAQIVYENPHTMLTVRTTDANNVGAEYIIEWGNLAQLRRWSITKGELKAGDHVIVTGSARRDPLVHKLSLLTDIRRPADDWHWSRKLWQ